MAKDSISISKESIYWIKNLVFAILFTIFFRQSLFLISFFAIISITILSFYHNKKQDHLKTGNWPFTIIMLFFSFLVFMLFLNKMGNVGTNSLALSLIFIAFILIMVGLFSWTKLLMKSEKLHGIIISYIILIILIISLFGGAYAFFGGVNYEGSPIEQDKYTEFNYYYFSTMTFYSMSYGDFIPTGTSRIISMLEILLSSILHIFVIGWILSKPRK